MLRAISMVVAITMPIIAGHEGLRMEPYEDIAGVETVCYGETEGINKRAYTRSECLVRLAERVARDYEAPISKCTAQWDSLPLPVQSASVSLAYNIGVAGFCGSSVRKSFDRRDLVEGCNNFLKWDKARVNGRLRQVEGLIVRRRAERKLCLEGIKRS